MATITCYGAAQEVTGSCHLLHTDNLSILFDCGLHQGGRVRRHLEADPFKFNPAAIDAVVLSHAHLDHSGRLPALVHEGFNGPIYCTHATAQLLPVMLHDAFSLYQSDLKRLNRKHQRQGKPLISERYSYEDIQTVLTLCKPKAFKEPFTINKHINVTLFDAGHILGSAITKATFTERGASKTLVYSGDLGKHDTLLMNDPQVLEHADVVMMEGTYGDRDHRDLTDTLSQFKSILNEAYQRKGNALLPAFAVGRTQELLLYLGKLQHSGELDDWTIFLDSPMAIEVTRIYDQWLTTLDCEGMESLSDGDATLLKNFISSLHLTIEPEHSMAINNIRNRALIIAGSGMCTGGRITHHIRHRIWDKRNTIIFVGYQAQGTPGRALVDGVKSIRLFGEDLQVNASVETLGGFSAHAGQQELVNWLANFKPKPRVLLVHGEADALDVLSEQIWQQLDICSEIPFPGQMLAF
ncbi:MBL fold metallo-hydrolase RNA specificity domain-containing protein [Thalassotalea mangrovi]|uniref:MBL fold metallo-hydrolase n=1 Tax=Thalassotalea mangrovi TaxID=2572245 RepID=A0A4U1B4I1_9GAMM|nr:MBL fold metallo-hydrolase [Thalassotalea mangrovi]TKB45087.1 MBL fold metallo-hydrolase [Thalassotalea mangrovi]